MTLLMGWRLRCECTGGTRVPLGTLGMPIAPEGSWPAEQD